MNKSGARRPRPGATRKSPLRTATALRAHHLLCVLGFRGLGYSREFVENMSRIVGRIKSTPDTELLLTDLCDDVCSACPHRKGRRCARKPDSATRVRDLDRRVLARLGLKPRAKISARRAYALVAASIATLRSSEGSLRSTSTPDQLEGDICGDCEWKRLRLCSEGLKSLADGRFFTERSCQPSAVSRQHKRHS